MRWEMLGITVLVASWVWAGITYPTLATAKGWPRGAWLDSQHWATAYLVSSLTTLWAAWNFGGLAAIGLVLVTSWILAFLITQVLGRKVQLLTLLALPSALIWWAISFWIR